MAKCVLACPVARYAITKKPKNPWTFLVEAARRDRTEGSTVVKQALRQLEPDVVKNLLLNHARRCKREHCPTCMKLKNRIAVVKRVKETVPPSLPNNTTSAMSMLSSWASKGSHSPWNRAAAGTPLLLN